jgi:predicted ribosome quality control (RQC) complex YloA/Tae2 family protein
VPLDRLSGEIGTPEFDLVLSHIVLHHLESHSGASFQTLSEASEAYHTLINERRDFTERRQRLISHTSARLKKQRSLRAKLTQELTKFGTADNLRRFGELLLANLQSAAKSDDDFLVTDYFDPDAPVVRIPAADQPDARTAAAHYFRLARKAKTGAKAIAERIPVIDRELQRHEGLLEEAGQITSMDKLSGLLSRAGLVAQAKASKGTSTKRQEKVERISGVRRYKSSDGYEILVGRTERDNDNLTLRIAKSFDLWFHSADYPGSHVVLRNPQRKPVAARSITEAEQLAAKFSHAKGEAKVAVHYCERKFVSKSKGAPPGQVRLSSFKTILVEPREAGERIS